MPTVREAAFAVFQHFGVDRMFGNPGSTEIPMLKALPFPYVLGLNEAVVVGMADGYARSSGKPALAPHLPDLWNLTRRIGLEAPKVEHPVLFGG